MGVLVLGVMEPWVRGEDDFEAVVESERERGGFGRESEGLVDLGVVDGVEEVP